jgi:hypothetical protein
MFDRDRIRSSIERCGHFTVLVQGGTHPRYLYTIGLTDAVGFEVVVAGESTLLARDAFAFIDDVADLARSDISLRSGDSLTLASGQECTLVPADPTWAQTLMLWANEFYGRTVSALHAIPADPAHSIDRPDMSAPLESHTAGAWRWSFEEWPFDAPADSSVATHLDVVAGAPVTEVTRWEVGYWEMVSGPGVQEEDSMRVMPLGTLLASDPALHEALTLDIGQGLWRPAAEDPWRSWRSTSCD